MFHVHTMFAAVFPHLTRDLNFIPPLHGSRRDFLASLQILNFVPPPHGSQQIYTESKLPVLYRVAAEVTYTNRV